MNKQSKIYIAGHRGMVGSAIYRKLNESGYNNIVTKTHKELDLTRQRETEDFFLQEQPEYVFLAAAKVGGILGNSTYKADFIYQNIMIAANIIQASYKQGVKKLLNLGSTCIYPRQAPQPLKEESLLTGPLEPTNDAYAIAKISAIKLCRHYNEQYKTNFMSVMPTNLYGLNDNYNFETSHFLPAFIRKFHLAKLLENENFDGIRNDFLKYGTLAGEDAAVMSLSEIKDSLTRIGINKESITLWGSGNPYREFLFADDLADACVFIMEKYNADDIGEFVNLGTGQDRQIKDYAEIVKEVIGFNGNIEWDTSKPDGTPRKLSNISRIKKLGWSVRVGLEEGLRKVYEDYGEERNI
ncbi:GDP-L-fucose synthetase [hydrothermal vent metagenome]|uniref:GDP-L-fucose synthase n=1 Tax=hydrothermal vent metagenome TaxID=652676 RepID=A0A3B1DG38_9ZZZZ